MRRVLVILTVVATFTGNLVRGDGPTYAPVKSMSEEEFQRELAHSKHYDFELASPDGLVDSDGTHISAENLMAYLRERHIDASAYFLILITDASPPLDTIAPTVDPLGRFGANKIVFRHKPGGQAASVRAEFNPVPGTPPDLKRVNVIQIRPNERSLTAGQRRPDLSGRPTELRPGDLPMRVRYAFGSDDVVIQAAKALRAHLLEGVTTDAPLWGTRVTVQYGAWHALKDVAGLGKTGATSWNTALTTGPNQVMHLKGVTLSDSGEIKRLEKTLVESIAASGGGQIHALTTEEMVRWWPFVGFDYTEPVLILATKDGAHAYAFLFENGRVQLVDDLGGLPVLSHKPVQ